MLERASELLRRAQRIVIFTGAGISAESGVPTFRDALTGLWERYDPHELATPQAFEANPDLVWGWYEWRRSLVQRVQPNAGHYAVAAIEARVPGTVVITQNVDDLHERAGTVAPIRLHGSLFAPRCSGCNEAAPLPDDAPLADGAPMPPPACGSCGRSVRPGVVWFGEALEFDVLWRAVAAVKSSDLLLAVGTSGLVYPAAGIPEAAAERGIPIIQVNPTLTTIDSLAKVNLRGTAATVLPALVAAAWPTEE